jgi:uncharacterized protein
MKKIIYSKLLITLLFVIVSLSNQGQTSSVKVIDSVWMATNYTKQEIMIPMRDGVKLYTAVYAPKSTTEKHPILMMRTPYSCSPYETSMSSRVYKTHWVNYIKEGYIIVQQDVRGKYMSEGNFVDIRPFEKDKEKRKGVIDEASDTYDAIDYLVKKIPNNNGRVGMFGISYPGFYSTMGALSNHPSLKAVSPQAPVTDWFMGDDFHHNGAFALLDGFDFYYSFGKPRPQPTTKHEPDFNYPTKDNYDFFLKTGAIKNFSKYFTAEIKFWEDLRKHPDYDEWWKARDARRACYNIKPAMLVVGGTFDAEDCYGAWNLYKAIEKQSPTTDNKVVMGPWFHGGWSRGMGASLGNVRFGSKTSEYYQTTMELPFFNYHLKGMGSLSDIAEANVFFTGENQWKQFNQWPPKEVKNVDYFLNEGGVISNEAPVSNVSHSSYISDPNHPVPYTEDVHLKRTREYMSDDQRFAARRPDVLTFVTPVLTDDITLAGTLQADLKVILSTSDADFVVKLIDVFPDDFKYDSAVCCKTATNEAVMSGYQMLVRGEIMRGRYRNSFEKPEAFVLNKPETVKFDLPDVAHVFKKGHKLMVQIQSTWFPLFDRNPQQFVNPYNCGDNDFIKSEIKLMHQSNFASKLTLPIVK